MRGLMVGLALAVAGAVACGRHEVSGGGLASGSVVDSALAPAEALRRFREGLPPVTSLEGGARSRDELMAELVRALGAQDTVALAGMGISRAEFAYLYYPTAAEALPPYQLEPGLMWFMLFGRSDKGIRRALRQYSGVPHQLLGYDCGVGATREGDNTLWGPCTIRWRGPRGDTASVRLIGRIIGRDGRYKILSFANKL